MDDKKLLWIYLLGGLLLLGYFFGCPKHTSFNPIIEHSEIK